MSSGVSSGYRTQRKPGHTGGRGRAVLQYGSSMGLTLGLKSKKMTSDKLCSRKAFCLNESGCDTLVDWS